MILFVNGLVSDKIKYTKGIHELIFCGHCLNHTGHYNCILKNTLYGTKLCVTWRPKYDLIC